MHKCRDVANTGRRGSFRLLLHSQISNKYAPYCCSYFLSMRSAYIAYPLNMPWHSIHKHGLITWVKFAGNENLESTSVRLCTLCIDTLTCRLPSGQKLFVSATRSSRVPILHPSPEIVFSPVSPSVSHSHSQAPSPNRSTTCCTTSFGVPV